MPVRRLFAALLAIVGATLLATAGGGTAGAASLAGGGHATRAIDCLETTSARVPKWAQHVHEPGEIGAAQSAQLTQQIQPALAAAQRDAARGEAHAGLVRVPTWVHVISRDRSVAGGYVSDEQISEQMQVLNRSFSGATGGAPTVFRFDLAGVTRTIKPAWARMAPDTPKELNAKSALHRGGPETLNLYVVAELTDLLLGWATYPGGEAVLDGVVVLAGSLPGGGVVPYNEGDTATHEVGHWLSLLHTFNNGCMRPCDGVFDTPYEAEPAFGCPIGADTCPQLPGDDPIENFMDYSDDPCMHEFTYGQSLRMWGAWRTFRG
jgi:hypothetical protein